MEADLQSFVAFYLTGKKQPTRLDDIAALKLRPSLFSTYRDLTALRYDYPLVLVESRVAGQFAEPLSRLIDQILAKVAQGSDAERLRKHVLALEQEIRVLAAAGTGGLFSELWDKAAKKLAKKDKSVAETLARARANLTQDGEVIDCNAELPARFVGHAWGLTQLRRAERFNAELKRLILKLSDIIRADYVNSDAGKSAENLREALGLGALNRFNHEAMSSILKKVSVRDTLSERRRERILGLIAVLQAQKFFPVHGAVQGAVSSPYSFAFESCCAALKAFHDRQPKLVELARALAVADLEARGEYNEARHDALFASFGENGLDAETLALFPDYLVRLNVADLSGAEQGTLNEILAADLPIKVLVQSDDLLEKSPIEHGPLAFSLRSPQLARMALGMGVFVLQAGASALPQLRGAMQRGLDHGGAALFSVYSGDAAHTAGLPPYLVAAAAGEARLFPAFCHDPSAGNDWAARFSLAGNAQQEAAWPVHGLTYQDDALQTQHETLAFTLADFVALDARYGRHFARVGKLAWNPAMEPVAETLAQERRAAVDNVPYLLMVDEDNVLQRVLVDEKIVREARRCQTQWRALQELAGIHNSHAARQLAAARAEWEALRAAEGAAAPAAAPVVAAPAAEAAAPVAAAPAPEAEPERSPDEAYIETPRCATCNECIQINGKMFAYDGNQQAVIVDINAGTYAQLVDAAENCQVAIIHPGKPRNPNEPGLEDLIKRAEAFQ